MKMLRAIIGISSVAVAYEKHVPDQISALEPEDMPGLDAYGVKYHLDLPMPLTTALFFD